MTLIFHLIKTDIVMHNCVCFSAAVEEETFSPCLSGVSFISSQESLQFQGRTLEIY